MGRSSASPALPTPSTRRRSYQLAESGRSSLSNMGA